MTESKPLFVVSGGMRKGKSYWLSSNYTWPLTKLEIFKNEIILITPLTKMHLKKSELDHFKRYKGLFSKGVQIFHKKTNLDKFIVFWCSNPEKLLRELKEAGYEVNN